MRKLVYVLLLISTYSLSTRAQSANFGNASNFFNLRPMNFYILLYLFASDSCHALIRFLTSIVSFPQ
jgi:hypothetical protein